MVIKKNILALAGPKKNILALKMSEKNILAKLKNPALPLEV